MDVIPLCRVRSWDGTYNRIVFLVRSLTKWINLDALSYRHFQGIWSFCSPIQSAIFPFIWSDPSCIRSFNLMESLGIIHAPDEVCNRSTLKILFTRNITCKTVSWVPLNSTWNLMQSGHHGASMQQAIPSICDASINLLSSYLSQWWYAIFYDRASCLPLPSSSTYSHSGF